MSEGMSPALTFLTAELGRLVGDGNISPEISLSELGADSLFLVELLLACEELYSKRIDFEKLVIDDSTTLRDLDRQILAF